jgi:NhaP-type Na+/H+ or K+/H+ antiporter
VIKLVFLSPFVLMVLADAANGHAVLPVFILGLVMSRHYQRNWTAAGEPFRARNTCDVV